jgi:monoamine oxidase
MFSHSMDRRTFMQGAGAAMLSAVSPSPGRAQNRAKVIVIGAGLSGLHTALMLEGEGVDVQVIEGRMRAGGRLKTLYDVPGQPEAGGNSFGGGYARLIDAAERYGVEYQANRQSYLRGMELIIDDKIVPMKDWPDHPKNPLPLEHKEDAPWEYYMRFMKDHVPLAQSEDWLDERFAHLDIAFDDWMLSEGASSETIDLCCNHKWEYNNSTHDVSALVVMMEYLWGRSMFLKDGKRSSFVIKGGNQRLPETMAGLLRKDVHYGKEVMGMRTGADGAEVHCADGTVYRGDRVVCSIPLPVLRRIKVEPYFTGVQRKAIWSVPRQLVTQVHLVPTAPFWEEDGYKPAMFLTDAPIGLVTLNFSDEDPNEVASMMALMMGNKAERMDQMDQESATAMVISTIEKIRPAAKGKLKVAGYKSWFRDPFASGDFTNFGPGQVTRFAGDMNAPHGRIHLCGDATALSNRGMEGALESSERVAIEIFSAI